VELVGRGKVGLGLQAEQQRLVAIDGRQPMMGGPAAAAGSSSTGGGSSIGAEAAEPAPPSKQGQSNAARAPDSSSGDGAGGRSVPQEPALGDGEQQQSPGSVVAVRLMTFARGWAAGTVTGAS
jgi:hypothetical protein